MSDKKHEWQLIHGNHDRQLRKALEALQTFIIDPDKKEQERALARLLEIDGKLSSRATLKLVDSTDEEDQ